MAVKEVCFTIFARGARNEFNVTHCNEIVRAVSEKSDVTLSYLNGGTVVAVIDDAIDSGTNSPNNGGIFGLRKSCIVSAGSSKFEKMEKL